MSFLSILDTIFLGPFKTIFEIIFSLAYTISGNVALSFIVLSFLMSILILPAYRTINSIQQKFKKKESELHDGVCHIKKNYSGDDRKTLLKDFYKKNNYSPISSLHDFMYLLFEIPLFVSSYQFITKLFIIQNSKLGPIANLAKSDSLINFGKFSINILPIFIAAISVISIFIYLKNDLIKSKIQLCLTPLLMFIFLYNAPSGLTFFWLIYNVFCLLNTISYKYKKPKIFIVIAYSVIGVPLIIASFFDLTPLLLGCLLQLPLLTYIIKNVIYKKIKSSKSTKFSQKNEVPEKHIGRQFIITSVLITLFVGLFIPSTYIAASPQEYINSKIYFNPLNYVLQSFLMAVSFFLLWLQLFYWLNDKKTKLLLNKIIFICSVIMLVDYMFFGINLGIISATLRYENGFYFSALEYVINFIVVVGSSILLAFTYKVLKPFISLALVSVIVILSCMSTFNIITSAVSVKDYKENHEPKSNTSLNFSLSTTGHNIVVIMLDRALGQYVPYIFNEKSELAEKFDGFTYYSNTLSFGYYTNICTPSLLGGYEYTPVELNKRDTESLKDKNNEANLVLPRLFSEAGYNVTVSDPVYINYNFRSELSIFDTYENVKAFYSIGQFVDDEQIEYNYEITMTNFFRFSFMKTIPLLLEYVLYDGGNYSNIQSTDEIDKFSNQNTSSISIANGMSSTFMDNYLTLANMDNMTKVTSDETNTFLFLRNDLTHEAMLLDEANNYSPSFDVNNTEYDQSHSDRFTLNGITLNIKNSTQMAHYQTNVAALIQLSNWFDHLKENGTYDNTRIIIASDHGRILNTINELKYDNVSLEGCAPLLMVKDFNSTGFKTSTEFMTNADVATLATQNLEFEAKNPFTGKTISMDEKYAHPQYISTSLDWNVQANDGNSFKASKWLSFDSTKPNCNIYDLDNWDFLNKSTVLKSHSF